MRWRVDLAYSGTAYHGWQRQPNAVSVQATLEKALATLIGQPVELVGAGRTDTGVHARAYTAHCDVPDREYDWPAVVHALNALLPPDVAVYDVRMASPEFHARFDAVARTYEYHIARRKDPFLQGRAYCYTAPLDFDAMQQAAAELLRFDDFASFCKAGSDELHTRCQLFYSAWRREEPLWVYTVRANRFLRNMVRALVGSMLEVGRGRWTLRQFLDAVEARDRCAAGPSARPEGLYLVEVDYP